MSLESDELTDDASGFAMPCCQKSTDCLTWVQRLSMMHGLIYKAERGIQTSLPRCGSTRGLSTQPFDAGTKIESGVVEMLLW